MVALWATNARVVQLRRTPVAALNAAFEVEIKVRLLLHEALWGHHTDKLSWGANFDRAVQDVAAAARVLMQSLVTNAAPRNREMEAEKARRASVLRFGVKDPTDVDRSW